MRPPGSRWVPKELDRVTSNRLQQTGQSSLLDGWPYKKRRFSCENRPSLANDVSKLFFTRTWFSLPKLVQVRSSLAEEPNAGSGSELNVGDAPGIASPAHVASNDMTISKYPLHDRYMAQTIRALDPGLEDNDSSRRGSSGDTPAELNGARYPLPGVGLHFPGNKEAM